MNNIGPDHRVLDYQRTADQLRDRRSSALWTWGTVLGFTALFFFVIWLTAPTVRY